MLRLVVREGEVRGEVAGEERRAEAGGEGKGLRLLVRGGEVRRRGRKAGGFLFWKV